MNFIEINKLSGLLSKNYAKDFLKLLVNYESISASEAASRLNLHIKTAQDFLESLFELNYLFREQIIEKKRPYFRYKLIKQNIEIKFDLNELKNDAKLLDLKVREKKDSNCIFNTSPKTGEISTISYFIGEGRAKKECKTQLTKSQGKFLFHLPFPTANAKTVIEIMNENKIPDVHQSEIVNLIELLIEQEIVETIT